MTTFGYIQQSNDNKHAVLQMKTISSYSCDEVYFESKLGSDRKDSELNQLLSHTKKHDVIVVHSIDCLGKNFINFNAFIRDILEKEVNLIAVVDNFDLEKAVKNKFIETLDLLINMERTVIKKRTTQGIEKARMEGRFGGRPSLDEDLIIKIKSLRKQKYTIRAIANACDISIGTVHKYIRN